MLNSKALTKIQSIWLVAIIVVAAVGGIAAYIFLNGQVSSETIKIGVIGNLAGGPAKSGLEGALLAVEQINAEGGVLGRLLEVVSEDAMGDGSGDAIQPINALTKLITVDKADFIIGVVAGSTAFSVQDVIAEHKKIYLNIIAGIEELTQRVLNDYDKYKYFFRSTVNASATVYALVDEILYVRELTGFNKIAYLADATPLWDDTKATLDLLPENHGFELVWNGETAPGTVDFTSYFAAAEAAGAEVLITLFMSETTPFLKEYHARQSPMVIWGINMQTGETDYWAATDGKCEYTTFNMLPIDVGYPITNKTLATREALLSHWDEILVAPGAQAYDAVRFVLADALERAGTTETEAVIKALEETRVETSMFRNFEFTSSHDLLLVKADMSGVFMFQWQADGTLAPIYPKETMEETGATYLYPPWPGPWD